MKIVLIISSLIALPMLIALGFGAEANSHEGKNKARKIVLEEKNTVSLRLPFFGSSVQAVQAKLLELSNNLADNEPIYLYMNTPGGSIFDGENMIQSALAINNEVKTITNFAASMGYITAQALGERLIMPNGVLMAHRAYVGIEGQIPGEFNTFSTFIQETVTDLETRTASRMGIEHGNYAKLVKDEYWRVGARAVKDNAADAVVQVSCAASLNGNYEEVLMTNFGPAAVTWAKCPLLANPLSIDFSGMTFSSHLEEQRITQLIRDVIANPRPLAQNQNMREQFLKVVR